MKEQRRGRRIAMSSEELDKFLAEERTCRVATVGADGRPHNTPLWFVWDGQSLWLNSIVKSQRWTDVTRRPQASVVVDAGDGYDELRGVEIIGQLELVGEAPRSSTPDAQLEEPERLFGAKYIGGTFQPDGRHAWMRLSPEKIVSWDFRKLMG
jgi:PPOX class probable F420-dependent enzyme